MLTGIVGAPRTYRTKERTMLEALKMFVPLFAFMLLPLWIPLVAVVGGKVVEVLSPVSD